MISQKATILCVYEILKKYSDENHIMSADDIRKKLKAVYDVDMERRSVYRNIDALRSMGIEIEGYQDNRKGYYLIEREFELPEVRLLCDAVAASAMITQDKSKQLVQRLIGTQSVFQGRMLQKTVYVKPDGAVSSKQIFYNIDAINVAINQGCMVSAKLMKYGYDMTLVEAETCPETFSPYATLWAEGNYYIVVKIEGDDQLTQLRLDLLRDIVLLEREADAFFGRIDLDQYARKNIINQGQCEGWYCVECEASLWDEIVERFGLETKVTRDDGERITARIFTTKGKMKKWVLNHLTECSVLEPRKFRDEIQAYVGEAYERYWKV